MDFEKAAGMEFHVKHVLDNTYEILFTDEPMACRRTSLGINAS